MQLTIRSKYGALLSDIKDSFSHSLHKDCFSVKLKRASVIGIGSSEIQAVIIAVGSAGVFSTIRDIIIEHMKPKPNCNLSITVKKKTGEEVSIEISSPDALERFDEIKKHLDI